MPARLSVHRAADDRPARSCTGRWIAPSVRFLFAACAVLIGCREPADPRDAHYEPQGEIRVAFIGPPGRDVHWPAIRDGGAAYLAQYPPHRALAFTPEREGVAALAEAVRRVREQNAQAACILVDDPDRVRPVIPQMVAAGLVVVTIGQRVPISGIYGHVDVNWAQAAELLADNLLRLAGGRSSYVVVHQARHAPLGRELFQRFQAHAERQYGMRQLEAAAAGGGEATGQIGSLLRRFPNVGLVVTLLAEPWLRDDWESLLTGGARFATVGCTPQLWPALRSGQAAGLAGPVDGEIGRAAAAVALAGLTRSEPAGVYRMVPSELVTAETLEDFERRYLEAAGWTRESARPAADFLRP